MAMDRQHVEGVLSKVLDPTTNKDIISSERLRELEVSETGITVSIAVSSPAMHERKRMEEAVAFALEKEFGKDIAIEVSTVVEAPKVFSGMDTVKNIVAIASGKGGVGKSTVTANMAVGLAQRGFKVALVDADIYGPSMPIMLDTVQEKPKTLKIDGKSVIDPVVAYGIKMLSIGFFADPSQAIVWRGAMANKALKQMFHDTYWGEIDYMLIDLPPGTGDIHLSIVQSLSLSAAIVVTTPQEIALADARKGIAMFQLPNINVPVVGIVENMSWFTPAELPDNKYYIFGQTGAKGLSEETGIEVLAQLPLIQSVREAADAGRPAIMQEGTAARQHFDDMVDAAIIAIDKRNKELPATERVQVSRT